MSVEKRKMGRLATNALVIGLVDLDALGAARRTALAEDLEPASLEVAAR